jgi:hypothetical protein
MAVVEGPLRRVVFGPDHGESACARASAEFGRWWNSLVCRSAVHRRRKSPRARLPSGPRISIPVLQHGGRDESLVALGAGGSVQLVRLERCGEEISFAVCPEPFQPVRAAENVLAHLSPGGPVLSSGPSSRATDGDFRTPELFFALYSREECHIPSEFFFFFFFFDCLNIYLISEFIGRGSYCGWKGGFIG